MFKSLIGDFRNWFCSDKYNWMINYNTELVANINKASRQIDKLEAYIDNLNSINRLLNDEIDIVRSQCDSLIDSNKNLMKEIKELREITTNVIRNEMKVKYEKNKNSK